ncbi:MAG: 2-isopropylmalate synthase, partial [Alphaproteobacteria bacterium]|nr:2-isopropylmalate synthase [Alphaproteobacteria bacterium]
DVIEAGFPIASPGDFEAVNKIAGVVKNATVCGLCRAKEADIEAAAKAIEPARSRRIHTFISTSPLHMKHKLQMEPDAVLEAIKDSVTFARSFTDDVEWSAEDASRTEEDFLCRSVEIAIDAGARVINIPDTVGYAMPDEYAAQIAMLFERVPNIDKAIISTHCHNDLGVGVANSLAGVNAGARQIECTINGIGERAGNAALEEIVMAMRTRHDLMPYTNGIETARIAKASRTLSSITGFSVQPNKAIVGANAFAHASGIHQDGMLKNANTYEIMTPESVGCRESKLVMSKHSGRHAFRERLKDLGFDLGDNALNEAFNRFKKLADRKSEVFEDDLIALVEDQIVSENNIIQFVSMDIRAGTKGPQTAELTLSIEGKEKTEKVEGNGPVDAIFKAVRKIYLHPDAKLELYQVKAVTGGTDAQAEVQVRLEENGKTVMGSGADVDTLVASTKAYVHALNKLILRRESFNPQTGEEVSKAYP